jgi:hypothetical protein
LAVRSVGCNVSRRVQPSVGASVTNDRTCWHGLLLQLVWRLSPKDRAIGSARWQLQCVEASVAFVGASVTIDRTGWHGWLLQSVWRLSPKDQPLAGLGVVCSVQSNCCFPFFDQAICEELCPLVWRIVAQGSATGSQKYGLQCAKQWSLWGTSRNST